MYKPLLICPPLSRLFRLRKGQGFGFGVKVLFLPSDNEDTGRSKLICITSKIKKGPQGWFRAPGA